MNDASRERLEFLINYLNALTQIKSGDGSTVLWANQKAGEVSREIDKILDI